MNVPKLKDFRTLLGVVNRSLAARILTYARSEVVKRMITQRPNGDIITQETTNSKVSWSFLEFEVS